MFSPAAAFRLPSKVAICEQSGPAALHRLRAQGTSARSKVESTGHANTRHWTDARVLETSSSPLPFYSSPGSVRPMRAQCGRGDVAHKSRFTCSVLPRLRVDAPSVFHHTRRHPVFVARAS